MTDTNNTDGAALLPVTQAIEKALSALDDAAEVRYLDRDDHVTKIVGYADAIEIVETLRDAFHGLQDDAALLADANSHYSADQLEEIARHRIATQEDAERSGAVGVTESDRAFAILACRLTGWDGVAQRLEQGWTPDPDTNEGKLLEAAVAHRSSISTPQRQEYDGEAVREAVIEECARIADNWNPDRRDRVTETSIAEAIRALAHPAQATPSALSGEHCQRCGHNNPSWSAPSPLWNAVIRGGSIDGEPKFDDMVCASCFMELAEQAGIASNWRVDAQRVNVPLETTTPTGRVWDADQWLWGHPDEASPAQPVDETERLHIKALRAAEQFIVNGVEMGYIRMPDAETPDTAHDTLPLIRAALTDTKGDRPMGDM